MAAVLLWTLALPVAPTQAFWNDGCGKLRMAGMRFPSDSRWTSSLRTQARDAFHAWDQYKFDGSRVMTYSSTQGPQYDLTWASTLMGNTYARTNCFGAEHFIAFNTMYYTDFKSGVFSLGGVATHEWGHAFGYNHTQDDPADRDGLSRSRTWLLRPSMSTCTVAADGSTGDASWLKTIDQDDAAAQEHATNYSNVAEYHSLTPNSSFENDSTKQWWDVTPGVSTFTAQSGGHAGQYSVSLKTPGSSSVYNTARYHPLDDNESDTYPSFGAHVALRRDSALHVGGAYYSVKVRSVRYNNRDGNPCQHYRDWDVGRTNNMNDLMTSGQFVQSTFYCNPAGGSVLWQACADYLETRPNGEAWDVRVIVRAQFTDATGVLVPGRIDHAKAIVKDLQAAHRVGQ